MMNVIDTDNNNYNYYNHYSESHRSSVSTTWSSEDPPPPAYYDRNFHRHRRHQHPGGGADYSVPARKRPFSHGTTADCSNDGRGFVKLYVADIPSTVTEEELRSLFEVHGNIVEIAIIKDPRTGQQKEYCFVKYTTMEEADRAIGALNYQYVFTEAAVPIKVRYADGERDRLVNIGDHVLKLYVNGLNKQASKWEIGEIFSAYGQVENIHIVRDEFKQSRGCGFIQFTRRDMAIAAKNALDGKFIMTGCDQPLLIRFADPKKPRFGDIRNNSKFGDSVAGSHFQEPVVRPVPYFNDSMAENVPSNVSRPFSPKTMASPSQSPRSGGKLDTVCSTPTASEPTDLVDCDWSEHTCPDGYKYYYNCVSCESRWEKPQEYSLFEQRLQKQQENQQQEQRSGSGKQSHSPSTPQIFSMEEIPQFQQTRIQSQLTSGTPTNSSIRIS